MYTSYTPEVTNSCCHIANRKCPGNDSGFRTCDESCRQRVPSYLVGAKSSSRRKTDISWAPKWHVHAHGVRYLLSKLFANITCIPTASQFVRRKAPEHCTIDKPKSKEFIDLIHFK